MCSGQQTSREAALREFGHQLKNLRLAADLTQEELAERAGVSSRLISDLERGSIHRPRRDTVQLLADGLRLRGVQRDWFIALARGHAEQMPQQPVESASRVSLPHPPTPIVGRLREIAAVLAHLVDPKIHLVTLTGPGGVGKTRLALESAHRAAMAFAGGAAFVDLSPLRDPEHLLTAIAGALHLKIGADQSAHVVVFETLATKQFLLILDNFEHLTAAANTVADLLAASPGLTILATSRIPLHIRAECEYPVGPLPLLDNSIPASIEEIASNPAVELFVRRAEETNREFALTADNAAQIVDISIRLDGLPLAIELAATRTKVLPPAQLLARLQRRLPLLTQGARDLPQRQQTLRATLDWSHALLTEDERALYRRLAVFSGGCTLEAAEFLDSEPGSELGSGRLPTVDLLGGLVDKSFLRVQNVDRSERRFVMLETIREYAWEQLSLAGEEADTRDRHLAWCIEFAGRAVPELTRFDQLAWFHRLEAEHDNMRAALSWAMARRKTDDALRLSACLAQFWTRRGYFDEGRRWLEQALALDVEASSVATADALVALARIGYQQGRYDVVPLLEKALNLYQAAGCASGEANALGTLGIVLEDLGEFARASELEGQALELFRQLDDRPNIARLLNSRGLAAYDLGEYDRAAALLEEALALGRSIGSLQTIAHALNNLALVAQEHHDFARANRLQAESLEVWRSLGDEDGIADCLENFAMFAFGENEIERSTQLFGAAFALRARIHSHGRPSDLELLERFIDADRCALGETAFHAAWREGELMAVDDAIALAVRSDKACT